VATKLAGVAADPIAVDPTAVVVSAVVVVAVIGCCELSTTLMSLSSFKPVTSVICC